MTTQNPEGPLEVETISSYARRLEDRVRVVLHPPELDCSGEDEVAVRFKSPRGAVTGVATATAATPGTLLETEVPATSLDPGIWRLAVQPRPDADFRRARARLLTSATQPVALLAGRAPRSSISPPKPVVPPSPKARLARRAGKAIDRALAPLPEDRADRYRAAARRAARRILR